MAKYIAIFSDTLDELEINGFEIMTDKEVETFEELASSITWEFVYSMGENELVFSDGEDLLSRIDFREITNDEAKHLKKVFPENFGVFIGEDYLTTIIGDELDEDEDDSIDEDDEYSSNDEDDDDY